MKKVFSLFLCLACFLSVGMLGGCSETDLSGVQSQIDELNATISALEDRLSAAEGNNTELQNKLNQANAKLATLEGKINGEPIEYLNEGEKATFVNNGIKLFDIQVMKGTYRDSERWLHFNFFSNFTDNAYEQPFNVTAFFYNTNTKKLLSWEQQGKSENVDNTYTFADFLIRFSDSSSSNAQYQILLFSNYTYIAGYELSFINPY